MLPPLILSINANASGAISALGGLTSSITGTTSALGQAQQRTRDLEREIHDAAQAGDMTRLAQASQALGQHLNTAQGQAAALATKMQKVSDVGAGLAAAGAGGLLLAQSFITASQEAERLDVRLQSILKTQGRLADLGAIETVVKQTVETGHFDVEGATQLKEAASQMAALKVATKDIEAALPRLAAMARSTGQSVGETIENFSEGYRNVSFEDLEELGLYYTDDEKKDLDKVKETAGLAAAQIKFMQMFLREADSAAGSLTDSLSEGEAVSNDLARGLNKIQSAMGRGAAESKKEVDNLLASVLQLVGADEKAGESAGKLLFIGSAASTAGGSILALGAQIVTIGAGMQAMGLTAAGVWASVVAGAGAAAAAIAAIAIPVAAVTLAIGGLWVAWQGSKDAGSMSDGALKKKWGKLGEFWVNASGSNQDSGPTQEDRDSYEAFKKSQERRGKAVPSFEQWRGTSVDDTPSADPIEEAKAKVDAALKQAQGQVSTAQRGGMAPSTLGTSPATPASPSLLAGALSTGGAPSTLGAGDTVESLQEQILLAGNKYEKEDLQKKLFYAQRAKRERDKYAKELERERDKALKAEADRANTLADTDADLRSAQIEEFYASRIAALEARAEKGEEAKTAWQKSMLEADKVSELGRIYNDSEGELAFNKKNRLAEIRAQGIRERANLLRQKEGEEKASGSSLAAMFAAGRLRGSYDREGGPRTSGGSPFGMPGANYGAGLPNFTGDTGQRMADAARAAATFRALNYQSNYGRDVGGGGGQASVPRVLDVRIREIVTNILGDMTLRFQDVPLGNNGVNSFITRAG